MTEDAELLRQYAQRGSETAFADLVNRHLPLVYSAALRQVRGDEALAKDVAQTVFIDLARKAGSLLDHELLAGWLYTSTRLAASKAVRGDQRRQRREQIAVSMEERTAPPESEQDHGELKQVLDQAMSELGSDERNAVLIRFFQDKELKDVGLALGISEDAARMRITRALAKLQVVLKQRGVTISTVALGTALATEAVAAVPAGLGASISATAVASAAAGGVATLSILKTTTMAKLTLGIAGAVLIGVLATLFIRDRQAQIRLLGENEAMREQIRQAGQLAVQNERLSNQLVVANSATGKLPNEQLRELLRLRGEVGVLRRQNAELKEAQQEPKQNEQTGIADSPSSPRFSLHLLVDAQAEDGLRMTNYQRVVDAAAHKERMREEVLNVQKAPLLDQTAISSAGLGTNWQTGQPEITITLTPQGASQLAKLTRENIDNRIAIVFNGQLCSAPVIRAALTSGKMPVLVPFPEDQARELVRKINEAVSRR